MREFVSGMIEICPEPVLVVKFDHEDLKTNLIGQVKRMQDFLKGSYMEVELKGRLAKAISKGTWFKFFLTLYTKLAKVGTCNLLSWIHLKCCRRINMG